MLRQFVTALAILLSLGTASHIASSVLSPATTIALAAQGKAAVPESPARML
ncbi:MAG TPA: hypothetical protein VGP33_12015 [Chloroflexota bacterium]|jgi:hypothetical protein|nr:hypothetical protein [Chloroflexota bacterium]